MIFNFKRIIAFIFVLLAWILFTFFFIGCASVDNVGEKEGWMPSGMSEDAQDYPTKYNMMDSPDGSKNPNAQVNIFRLHY